MTSENGTKKGPKGAEPKPDGNYSETVRGITWDFEVKDGKSTILKGGKMKGAVAIPSKLGGHPVTSIGDRTFESCCCLTSVTIPDTVTDIGDYAFEGCQGLISVTIPDSVTSIGALAFARCGGLTSVTIPDSITSIGASAFFSCASLTSVKIPDSVTSIGKEAFEGCKGLTSVTIGNGVATIGAAAFSSCEGLNSFFVSKGNKNFKSVDGIVFSMDGKTIAAYPPGRNGPFDIPDSVTAIGDGAFAHCVGLTSVTIPSSVTGIGCWAFDGCVGLASVTIPDSVTTIGDMAFHGCVGLTSVTIPNSVTSIGNMAFGDCIGLTSVTIPGSVKSIGSNAFIGCKGLASVEIGNGVTSIGSYAFWNRSLTSVTIPASVTSIGENAFDPGTTLKRQGRPKDADMTIEDADLRGDQCVDRLKKDPSFADKCDWSRLSSWDWMNLLCSHPEYADHCDWSELDYDTVVESCLLDDQPQLTLKCDWSRFSKSQKAELLLEHPEFGQYTDRRQLIVELGCGQFVELGRKVIPLDDDDEEPVEDAKVSSRDRRRLYAVMNKGGIVHALSVRVFLGGKIVFEHDVSPEDACGVTFDDCGDLFDIAPPKNGRWLYGAECNDPTSITPWQADVPARFKFDPSKLRIPYCRARISAFPETALLVAPEEIRYGRRRPDTSGEDGDFVIDHKYDDMPDRTTTQSFWLETENGPEEYDGPWAEDDGDGGFFDEAFHFVTVEHVE